LLIVLVLLVLTPAVGSGQTIALQADFNSDTANTPPSTAPAGNPPNDKLVLPSQNGSVVVVDSVGTMTDQPVLLSRNGSPFQMRADLDPDYNSCDQYVVRWTSMVRSVVGYWYVAMSGPAATMAAVEFRGGFMLTLNGSGNPLGVGYAADVPQEFEVRLDMNAQTLNLYIDGVHRTEVQDQSFVQNNPSGEMDSIYFLFGLTDNYQVVIDDIEVVGTGCAPVAVSPSSWGTLKSRFK